MGFSWHALAFFFGFNAWVLGTLCSALLPLSFSLRISGARIHFKGEYAK